MRWNDIAEQITGAAIGLHRGLGPGLIVSTSEAWMQFELVQRGPRVERQKGLPFGYRDGRIDRGDPIDLLVEHPIGVELKAVAQLEPIHGAQLLSSLKLPDCHVGLLVDFHVKLLKDGIRRLVTELKA